MLKMFILYLMFFANDYINPFLPNVPFWFPWKHQKTLDFLIFSGGSKENIGKVNNDDQLLIIMTSL